MIRSKGFVFVILATVALLSWTQAAVADTVTLTGGSGYGPYQTGSGGEFTFIPSGSIAAFLSEYSADILTQTRDVVLGSNNFQTFCLEFDEHVSANGTYTAYLNDEAIEGGTAPGGAGDPLSIGVAYLYYEFAKGTLTGYDYTNPGRSGATGSSADLLQQAIWFLEGEGGSQNIFTAAAVSMFTDMSGAMADNNGAYRTAVLNLYNSDRSLAQDVLIVYPIPEPTTLLLLGLGLAGLAAVRRFKK